MFGNRTLKVPFPSNYSSLPYPGTLQMLLDYNSAGPVIFFLHHVLQMHRRACPHQYNGEQLPGRTCSSGLDGQRFCAVIRQLIMPLREQKSRGEGRAEVLEIKLRSREYTAVEWAVTQLKSIYSGCRKSRIQSSATLGRGWECPMSVKPWRLVCQPVQMVQS